MFHVISIILSKHFFSKCSQISNRGKSPFVLCFQISNRGKSPFVLCFQISNRGKSPFVLCSDPMTCDHVTYLNCFNYSLLGLDAKNNINTALCKYLPHFCRIFRKMYRTFAALLQKLTALLPHFRKNQPHFYRIFYQKKQVRYRTFQQNLPHLNRVPDFY